MIVLDIWNMYEPAGRRLPSHKTDRSRISHVLRHLGDIDVMALSQADVDRYRGLRSEEKTVRGKAPTDATLDRELELLKRVINYAVLCRKLTINPLQPVKMLNTVNVRRSVLGEVDFQKLHRACPSWLRPIILVAFDTGMRKAEVLGLRWDEVDLERGAIRIPAERTKTRVARVVYLTERAFAAIKAQTGDKLLVFGKRSDVRKAWLAALKRSGLDQGLWFHDLRRSFITNARRRGLDPSIIKKFSGHRTDSVFQRYNIIEESDLAAAAARLSM